MLMDMMFIKSPREKNKLNFYLNDNNLYVQNSLKMRKKHLSYYNNTIKIKKELKKKYPVPLVIYWKVSYWLVLPLAYDSLIKGSTNSASSISGLSNKNLFSKKSLISSISLSLKQGKSGFPL